MKQSLRGKRGALVAFLAIAGLVCGGLGWVTAEALRLEREQQSARADAELSSKLRIALWRLDSRVIAAFTNEANRPYSEYAVGESLTSASRKSSPPVIVMELETLPQSAMPPWVGQHVILAGRSEWRTSDALRNALVGRLGVARGRQVAGRLSPDRRRALVLLGTEQIWQHLLAHVRQEDSQLARVREQDELNNYSNSAQIVNDDEVNSPAFQAAPIQAARPEANPRSSRQPLPQREQQQKDRDAQLRYALRAQNGKLANDLLLNSFSVAGKNKDVANFFNQQPAILGPLVPVWLAAERDERLVVARLIQVGPRLACHLMLLEWPRLEGVLAEHVADLFPQARFVPIRDESRAHAERAMSALPVELDPGPQALPAALSWRPVRVGLSLAWAAALLALAAVGLGGWSLLNLSERRIRFVSAVTHELRTPLTTLRLYLDMLTGGLVADEQQKQEYLKTLHAEAERLHRLIGNVLDFSRLENQRPRLEVRSIALVELLCQLLNTWRDRCHSADKELVVENHLEAPATLHTDVYIVHQIIGNLIDNSCKYSRGADDRRIWLRSLSGERGGLILEVADHGPGVPAGEGRSVFRPFNRGRGADVVAGGVGLGLALAQRWAGLLGGRLQLHDAGEDGGACFRLELPADCLIAPPAAATAS